MAVSTLILLFVFSNPPGVHNQPAVPSGEAQGAHHPVGTRGDIQAVTPPCGPTHLPLKSPFQVPSLGPPAPPPPTQGPTLSESLRVRDSLFLSCGATLSFEPGHVPGLFIRVWILGTLYVDIRHRMLTYDIVY